MIGSVPILIGGAVRYDPRTREFIEENGKRISEQRVRDLPLAPSKEPSILDRLLEIYGDGTGGIPPGDRSRTLGVRGESGAMGLPVGKRPT